MLRTFFYNHPLYHLKLFPTTTTFEEILLNHVVAYSFTYTIVSAQFLTNLEIHLSTTTHLLIFCILLFRLDAL